MYKTAEDLYKDFKGLRQCPSFSKEWHEKYNLMHSKVPFPDRRFGKRFLPDKVDPIEVDGGARMRKRTKPQQTSDSETHVQDKQDLPTDTKTEPWFHEGSNPPVFRLKAEYIARVQHLEEQLQLCTKLLKSKGVPVPESISTIAGLVEPDEIIRDEIIISEADPAPDDFLIEEENDTHNEVRAQSSRSHRTRTYR